MPLDFHFSVNPMAGFRGFPTSASRSQFSKLGQQAGLWVKIHVFLYDP